jgi:tetratricopeptide (TPR) repeat protein
MRKAFPFLLLLFSLHPAMAQSKDSIAAMMQQYDYHGALMEINKINSDSLDFEILYLKAKALNALSRFSEAIACFDSIYKSDSSNIKVALELADCYKSVSNLKKPQEIYEKALLMNPANNYIRQLLANVCMTTEQYLKAKELYLTSCSGDTTGHLLKQIAGCYEKLGMEDSAICYYRRAMQWNPNDYQPPFRLASLYKSQNEFEKGIAVTDTFLTRIPDNRDVNRLSGYLHYLNKDFPVAVERFLHSIALSDTSVFVNKYLGYSYFKKNDFTGAIKYLEKVFAVDSTDAEMCYALGLANDPPENIRYFNTAINIASPVVNMLSVVYQDLSLALTKAWKYNDALDALMKSLELTPRDPAILYKIGVHYDNWMDDKAMALKYYRDFLSTRNGNTDSPYVITSTSVITREDYDQAESRVKNIESSYIAPPIVVSDTIVTYR